jgi:predicted ATP-dependent serine protease
MGVEGLDRVLGQDWRTKKCGIHVPSTILFAGAAGSGKSTLLLRSAAGCETRKFLYLSTEQTIDEINDNAARVGLDQKIKDVNAKRIYTLDEALEAMHKYKPHIAVIDSLFEITDPKKDTGDMHANLVRTTTAFKEEAERHRRAIILIAHMNKKEEIAGVQRVQHIVSTVLRVDKRGKLRVVHCPDKNRFGSTSEKAYFKMTESGLEDAASPAAKQEDDRQEKLEKRRFRHHVRE